MEQSVVIRHVSGTKGPAVEQISIAGRKELIAGRGSSCDIRYDLAADDLVSRRHMKIEIAGAGEPEFMVVDLNSRNGTFVNKRRIKERTRLRPGDVVQLGSGGPEFVFDLDPPNYETAPTEKTTAYNALSEATPRGINPTQPQRPDATAVGVKRPRPSSKRRRTLIVMLVLVALAAAAMVLVSRSRATMYVSQLAKSGWTTLAAQGGEISRAAVDQSRGFSNRLRTWLQRSTPKQESAQNKNSDSPRTAAAVNVNCLTGIEVGWMLLDDRSGRQLRQVYIDNLKAGAGGGGSLLVPGAGRSLPLFALLSNNRLEPVLTISDDVTYRPIGGIYRNLGFLAAAGQILTSRRIATPWNTPYEWPADATAGVVAKFDTRLKLVNTGAIARRQFPQWLPIEAQFILADSLDAPSLHLLKQVRLDGRTDYLTVSLFNESRQVSARLVRASERFDLAVIRVEAGISPGQQPSAARLRVGSDCKPGDPAVLLSLGSTTSQSIEAKSISEWNGNVVALQHDQDPTPAGMHPSGDRYQLAVSARPAVEPGVPVFDAQGRVFAIETPPDPLHPTSVFAIPIRYGLDLLSTPRN